MLAETGLHERLKAVVGDLTYRNLAEATGQNAETVRRYVQGQSPSVEFLAAICHRFDVNANWLLTGAGPRRQSEARADSLRTAAPGELMTAVSDTLERLITRVDRIETFVQTLESRVRAKAAPLHTAPQRQQADGAARGPVAPEPPRATRSPAPIHGPPQQTQATRPERIADALPKRPSADADRTPPPRRA